MATAAEKKKPWHEDFFLDSDEKIKVRIDDDTITWVTAWAVGEDISGLAEEAADPDTYDAFYDQTIAYWCDFIKAGYKKMPDGPGLEEVFYDEKGNANFNIHTHLVRGGMFVLHNCINDQTYEMTKDVLVKGIEEALLNRYDDCSYDIDEMLENQYLEYDGKNKVYRLASPDYRWYDFGDEAFQLALFGDLYYNHQCLRMIGGIRVYIPEYEPFAI